MSWMGRELEERGAGGKGRGARREGSWTGG